MQHGFDPKRHKLLNVDANAKTVKGQKKGYMTGVLYLAPFTAAGINVCPMAELAGCWRGCLNTAGRGGMSVGNATFATPAGDLPDNTIQHARIRRTRFWAEDRERFVIQLVVEINRLIRKAERKGLTPAVRLNGTSDIQWEMMTFDSLEGRTIFEAFPDVQFYDYTKIPKRFNRQLPANYHLSLSYSAASGRYSNMCADVVSRMKAPLVIVARNEAVKARIMARAANAVDGDETDLRFTDPAGATVVLRAKGNARKDTSGFVVD